ncbi:MAG: hypothetical protein E6G94_03725 [Alphaproteobacteria bacterium]|nr:MAG: hypothetical protein E6G94_03725 [Alphaproteobacteria bacterium]
MGGFRQIASHVPVFVFGGRIATRILRLAGIAAAGSAAFAVAGQSGAQPSASGPVWLDQNWSATERAWFHHAAQGTSTIPVPYEWFMALEQPDSRGMLADPAYLDQFGFIPSPRGDGNPDGLPIGFARSDSIDPANGQRISQIGFSCGACHTGRIDYRGVNMLIDGGPALTNLGMFRNALAKSLAKAADLRNGNFDRFARRLLPNAQPLSKERVELWKKLTGGLIKGLIAKLELDGRGQGTVEEGFGRLDALNRIGNEVFANQMGRPDNLKALTAPVAYPHIWDTSWFDWVQYNSSIEQPMVRNAGEAMGVSAKVNWGKGSTPLFTSTVPVDNLHRIESSIAGPRQPQEGRQFTGLRAPAWPGNILPPVDAALAERGAGLYREMHCGGCHLPAPNTEEFWTGNHWTPANAAGERYLALKVIPVSAVGTDEAQAADMDKRTIVASKSIGFPNAIRASGSRDAVYGFGGALGSAVEKVVNRWYDTNNIPAAQRESMNGNRPNGIRSRFPNQSGVLAYTARPLDGIWATAPYLHNGSVPTLYDLFSPYNERPASFWLGNREFDPVKVGYRTDKIPNGFLLVARDAQGRAVRGNWNGGHLFETPAAGAARRPGTIGRGLTPDERRALVEYLKTL